MLTVITSSGDHIQHERAVDDLGVPVEECVTCGRAWPCAPVVDVQDGLDVMVARTRGAA